LSDRLESNQPLTVEGETPVLQVRDKRIWRRPEIITFTPAREAAGTQFAPGDGVSNLC
jgi:hypothetical protein